MFSNFSPHLYLLYTSSFISICVAMFIFDLQNTTYTIISIVFIQRQALRSSKQNIFFVSTKITKHSREKSIKWQKAYIWWARGSMSMKLRGQNISFKQQRVKNKFNTHTNAPIWSDLFCCFFFFVELNFKMNFLTRWIFGWWWRWWIK